MCWTVNKVHEAGQIRFLPESHVMRQLSDLTLSGGATASQQSAPWLMFSLINEQYILYYQPWQCHDSMYGNNSWLVHHLGLDCNISTPNGCFAMNICTDIHSPQRVNMDDSNIGVFLVKCHNSYWINWHKRWCFSPKNINYDCTYIFSIKPFRRKYFNVVVITKSPQPHFVLSDNQLI